VIHGTILAFAEWPSDGPRLADLGRAEAPGAEGAKRSLRQTNFMNLPAHTWECDEPYGHSPVASDNKNYLAERERHGLRKAGVPEE
jgi:hypothetical protein